MNNITSTKNASSIVKSTISRPVRPTLPVKICIFPPA